MTGPDDAVARYLRALDRLGAVVDAVPAQGWDAATPCPGWSARQLLGHLVDGQNQVLAMLAGEGRRAPVADPGALGLLAGPDPAGSWRRAYQAAVAALSRAAPGAGVATPLGPRTVEQLLGIALVEPVVHTWDLATATGRPADLDPDAVRALLPGVLALGGQLQATGMYPPAVPVPDDAPAQDRLLAALGRRPPG
ncbi:TIGR03086 family protein [Geodermatophilus siccatus]|uniref:TIGR03086 family protein n=1 Tax=Geodermatophilus siccatus TaxID=1137991 RepID=A0A1G9YQ04_9ACTN|nr:TIGR03086 family metal-binding protein [Geodermatophilus siccatus]SDN11208.1 TIGR03086 family protein [Geodermatophilus siccatus]